jgi:hypothetical protein
MSIVALAVPILVSAVVVWFASAMIWMVLPWHKKDFSRASHEEAARAALSGLAPGNYMLPYCADQNELKDPEVRKKYEEGPLAFITVMPNGVPKMGGKLVGSFLYNVLVGILCAYVLTRTGTTESVYLEVFRISGTVAFISYGIAYVQDSIWFGRRWSITAKSLLDALIYALLTGGVFGWLVA